MNSKHSKTLLVLLACLPIVFETRTVPDSLSLFLCAALGLPAVLWLESALIFWVPKAFLSWTLLMFLIGTGQILDHSAHLPSVWIGSVLMLAGADRWLTGSYQTLSRKGFRDALNEASIFLVIGLGLTAWRSLWQTAAPESGPAGEGLGLALLGVLHPVLSRVRHAPEAREVSRV